MAKNSLEKARLTINLIDKDMAELFERRMCAVREVAEYKKENGMPILDRSRERQVAERGASYINDEGIKALYIPFIEKTMELSRAYQSEILASGGDHKIIRVNIGEGYDIHIGDRLIDRADEFFKLDRRVMILTDSGVPREYAEKLKALCKEASIITVSEGEGSKSFACLEMIEEKMLDFGMTRSDCVVAVGGGVVGDLAGFAASAYMRGVDFYNIPTTLLSQVDSSIGGKVAINLGGAKNSVGAFYQPKGVIIDPELLNTLPKRQLMCGLAEIIKMSLTCDEELFELIESQGFENNKEDIITRSLLIKKAVVEADEREGGIRKILNFGHTLGHAIESEELGRLYHGECVAIGMTAVCSGEVKERLTALLKKVGLPYTYEGDIDRAITHLSQDKKRVGDEISVILVDKIGSYRIEKMDIDGFVSRVREELK